MAYSMEVKEKFIRLRATSLSYDKISAEIDVPKQTLIQWGKDYQKEILAIEHERAGEFLQRCCLDRPSALEKTVTELEKINVAISAKDLMNEDLKTLLKMRGKNEVDVVNMVHSVSKSLERCYNNNP